MLSSTSPPPPGFRPLGLGHRIRHWLERMQQTPGISLIGELLKRLTSYVPKVLTISEALVNTMAQVASSVVWMATAAVVATVAWLRRAHSSASATHTSTQPNRRVGTKK